MTRLTLLHYNSRDEKRECFCVGMEERGSLYSSGRENMNGKTFNESWQIIKENHEPTL